MLVNLLRILSRSNKINTLVLFVLQPSDFSVIITLYNFCHNMENIQIPKNILQLVCGINERLTPEDSAKFMPLVFDRIENNEDIDSVWPQFAYWLLSDRRAGIIQLAPKEKAVKDVLDTYRLAAVDGRVIDRPLWQKLNLAARDAATNAKSDSEYAACDAASLAAQAAYDSDAPYSADAASEAAICWYISQPKWVDVDFAQLQGEKLLKLLKN